MSFSVWCWYVFLTSYLTYRLVWSFVSLVPGVVGRSVRWLVAYLSSWSSLVGVVLAPVRTVVLSVPLPGLSYLISWWTFPPGSVRVAVPMRLVPQPGLISQWCSPMSSGHS